MTDATGTRTFSYTDEDKLASETLPSSFYGTTTVLTRNYDTLRRDDGYSLSYDGSNVQEPDFSYDTYGRLSTVGEGSDTFTFGYLTGSDLVSTVSGPASIVQTKAYESNRDLIDYVENKVGTTTVSKYDYTTDSIGRKSSVQKSGDAFAQSDTVTWSYDDRSQVTDAIATNDSTYDYDFAYDPIGNRTSSSTKETGTTVTTTYTANQLNQYTGITSQTNPAYDNDGNMTLLPDAGGDWTLGWNGENRLVSAESSSAKLEFLYDYMGRRVKRKTYAGTTGNWTLSETRRFLYEGWNLIAEFAVDGETVALDRTHVWGLDLSQSLQGAGGVGGLLRTSKRGASVSSYYPTYDANGNISDYLDSTGATVAHYSYSPFGETVSATGTEAGSFSFRFSTKPFDATTSLYYYGFRDYAPWLGRWSRRDPIAEYAFRRLGQESTLFSRLVARKDRLRPIPQLYVFVENRPTDLYDVLGLDNPGCDLPTFLTSRMTPGLQQDSYLRCCALHDACYLANGCTSSSWGYSLIPPCWRSAAQQSCVGCNEDVASCFMGVYTGSFYPPPGVPRYFCPNGPNRGRWYDRLIDVPASCFI